MGANGEEKLIGQWEPTINRCMHVIPVRDLFQFESNLELGVCPDAIRTQIETVPGHVDPNHQLTHIFSYLGT